MGSRDDFPKSTREKLAHRAGYRCSKPDCRIVTRGAASDGDSTIDLGFAAHITAAAPNGPRYDASLTPEQRRHHSNGLWLCGTHAKLVDSDESYFTVAQLRAWKRTAEERSFNEVVSSEATLPPAPEGSNLRSTTDKLRECATADLEAFQRMPGWPTHPVALSLKLTDTKGSQLFTVDGLASAIETFDEISLLAPPGTGKTTTLIQVAQSILQRTALIAVYVPLNEWSTKPEPFLQAVLARPAFRGVDPRQIELLAEHGKLVLILDGWNELDESLRRRARVELNSLRRNFPDIRVVVSSRHDERERPVAGYRVSLESLTEDQQRGMAWAMRGDDGLTLLEHAWRTPGLRELVAIPLYLSVLLTQAPGASLPTTKEGMLRTFVSEYEGHPDKGPALRQELKDIHTAVLIEIAAAMTHERTTTLSDNRARAIANGVQENMKTSGQISQPLEPLRMLDALVNLHLLDRSASGAVSFQHQQFQEWYASFAVERLMLAAASGDSSARKILREQTLDLPFWEEAILFASERLSRTDHEGVEAISAVIVETLGIDPLLAAEMIFRSSEEVWRNLGKQVMTFAKNWHAKGQVDLAVRFMIATGRPEFSEHIWPLISNPSDDIHLRALRAGRRFRPTVLGPGVQERVASLPERQREHIISEIAQESGMDGIELATLLAKRDPSSSVRLATLESLVFRRAHRFVAEILSAAPDDDWRSLAQKWDPEDFGDPDVAQRIRREKEALVAAEENPRQIVYSLLHARSADPDRGKKIRAQIGRIDFSRKDQNDAGILHLAYERYPDDAVAALVDHLANGNPLPYGFDDLLRRSNVSLDSGPVAERVLRSTTKDRNAEIAVTVVGPTTVGRLMDRLLEVDSTLRTQRATKGSRDKELSDESHRLLDLIVRAKVRPFVAAILERSKADDPDRIAALADLISRHGRDTERKPLSSLDPETHQDLMMVIARWGETLLRSPAATRAQMAAIPKAAERLGSPSLVPALRDLLARDQTLLEKARQERAAAHARGHRLDNDAAMSWKLQYQRAFAAIGDVQTIELMKTYLPDPQFGVEAAHVLHAIWLRGQPAEPDGRILPSWPDFSVVRERWHARQSGQRVETPSFVDDILAVAEELIGPEASEANLRHALQLATVAFGMPHSGREKAITSLLEVNRPTAEKQKLLTVLAMSGITIPSDLVLRGIDEFLDKAKTDRWLLEDQDGSHLNTWLHLLPFTEKPRSVLDVLDRLEDRHKIPWRLRGLLSALGHAPTQAAEDTLLELARRDDRMLDEHDWLNALAKQDTPSAGKALLDLACSGSIPGARKQIQASDVARTLASMVTRHPSVREEIYGRFLSITDGRAKAIVERAIVDAPDKNGILLLVRDAAAKRRHFHATGLYAALRDVLVGERPSANWSGAQELYGRPAADLRKQLFHMALKSDAEGTLAAECLAAIDEIRYDYGGPIETEPRHPDITIGRPWPLIDLPDR